MASFTIDYVVYYPLGSIAFDHGIQFDGTNDHANLGSHKSLDITGNLSLEAWVYPNSKQAGAVIDHAQEGANAENYSMLISPGTTSPKITFQYYNAGWVTVEQDDFFTLNVWHHVVITYKAGTVKIYRNGILIKTSTGNANLLSDTSNILKLGRYQVRTQGWFFGIISEVRIYAKTISLDQIRRIYFESKPRHR